MIFVPWYKQGSDWGCGILVNIDKNFIMFHLKNINRFIQSEYVKRSIKNESSFDKEGALH